MARHRRRRGRGGVRGGQSHTAQTPPTRDLAADAHAALMALRQARLVAEALYAVTVSYVSDGELRSHRYDDVVERRLPLAHPDALLAVGCASLYSGQHGPQVRIPQRVLDRLSAADVTPADITRGERLATALLGVAASVAARDEAGRAGRFAAGVDRRGAVSIAELTQEAPVCVACLSDAEQAAWRERVRRGELRREAERAIARGDSVYTVSRRRGVGGNGGRPLH